MHQERLVDFLQFSFSFLFLIGNKKNFIKKKLANLSTLVMYCGGKNQEPKWIVPHCLMWCIWKERNSRCFEDSEHSMPDLKFLFFRTLLDCFSLWRNQPFSSILDLLDLCNFCIWYVHSYILLVYLGVSLFDINKSLLLIKKKFKNQNYNDQVKQEGKNKKNVIKSHSKQREYARKKT